MEVMMKFGNKDFLTAKQAADYLGIKMSTLYSYTSKKIVSFNRPNGRKIYFSVETLQEFLSRGRVASKEEIENEIVKNLIAK